MGTSESKILDNKSNIEFNFYIEPIISNDNDEIDIEDLSAQNCEKIKNYYDSKCFSITFEKFLKHDFLKFKMTSVIFEDNMLFFNGNIVLKNNNDNNDISLNEIEDFITKNIELNKENLLLKINHNNIYYNISFENDNISEIDFEFKSIKDNKNQVNNNDNNNLNDNKKIRIIKPRSKNESYEKEKIINRNIKIKKVSK